MTFWPEINKKINERLTKTVLSGLIPTCFQHFRTDFKQVRNESNVFQLQRVVIPFFVIVKIIYLKQYVSLATNSPVINTGVSWEIRFSSKNGYFEIMRISVMHEFSNFHWKWPFWVMRNAFWSGFFKKSNFVERNYFSFRSNWWFLSKIIWFLKQK